jgi:hypothetical protein
LHLRLAADFDNFKKRSRQEPMPRLIRGRPLEQIFPKRNSDEEKEISLV